jgi:hypothetical protein
VALKNSKFNEGIKTKLLECLSKAHTRKSACSIVGINGDTLGNWVRRGKDGESGYAEFYEEVLEAERQSVAHLVDTIRVHGQKDWRAAAWILERTKSAFKLRSRTSQKAQDELDALAIEKSRAEIENIQAKTRALESGTIPQEDVIRILEAARGDGDESGLH